MDESARQNALLTALLLAVVAIALLIGFATGNIDLTTLPRQIAQDKLPIDDPNYLYLQARDAYEHGDKTTARAVARRITYIKPDYKDAHKLLAAMALKEKDYETATDECRKVTLIDPTDQNARIGLGTALRSQGKRGEATILLQEVADDPRSTKVQKDEANLHLSELKAVDQMRLRSAGPKK